MQRVRNAQCPCCDSRESEMIQQMLFECKAPLRLCLSGLGAPSRWGVVSLISGGLVGQGVDVAESSHATHGKGSML